MLFSFSANKNLKLTEFNYMDALLNKLLEAAQVHQVTDVIRDLSEKEDVGWVPVGGKQNNLATINIGSDPAAGVIERITNAIDAVLEREWQERGQPEGINSPREAVAQWFGIEEGRLNSIDNPRNVSSLADRVQVVLRDSEKSGYPTVDIRDNGLGIEAKDFGASILSLNESLKLQKHFLAGAFGQGGSTALSYSLYTIIFSKPARVDGKESNRVAVTVVRFNEGDVERDKHGKYEYMVDGRTDVPFTFEANSQEFAEGTLVRHVAMDLGKYDSVMTTQTRSLWYLTHHYLFDPVLPFRIEEQRDNSSQDARRSVTGNHRLLSQGENIAYQRDAELTFRSGTVWIHWWVLSDEGENPKGRIRQYTLKSRPIVVTYNGQKQGEMSNRIIKDDLKLPYLEGYLVVHVDCDDLDNESRRQLFSTARESLRENNVMEDLRRLVVATLEGDPELPRLDEQRKQRFMSREDSESVAKVRQRLANRVKAFIKTGGGSGPTTTSDGESTNDRESDREPIPVEDPPTFIEITTDGPKTIHSGRRFALRFKTDAHPSYFREPETFVSAVDPASVGHYTGTASVKEGQR